VSVEERLVRYAQAVARQFEQIDLQSLLGRILADEREACSEQGLVDRDALLDGSISVTEAAELDGDPSAGSSIGGRELRQQLYKHTSKGDSQSALQIALLLEGLEKPEMAEGWWRRAAQLGDADAVDYVAAYLSPPAFNLVEESSRIDGYGSDDEKMRSA
jgi:hypothetical protein